MTRTQALQRFRKNIVPLITRYQKVSGGACAKAWENWMVGMHKAGEITKQQSETWTGPKSCRVKTRSVDSYRKY